MLCYCTYKLVGILMSSLHLQLPLCDRNSYIHNFVFWQLTLIEYTIGTSVLGGMRELEEEAGHS